MYTLIENQQGEMFAVRANRIERFPMADSYDNYGQKVGHYTAGDWLTIDTQEGVDAVNKWQEDNEEVKWYRIGDFIYAYDNMAGNALFDAMLDVEGLTLNQIQVKGFNYHDGRNWASIIVDMDNGEEAPYSYCDDELIEKFNQEVNTKEKTQKTSFGTTYETASFTLFNGNSASDWAAYDVTLK